MTTVVIDEDLDAGIAAAHAANKPVDITPYAPTWTPKDAAELEGMPAQRMMYYAGYHLSQVIEPGKTPLTIDDYAAKARRYIAAKERKRVDREAQVATCTLCMERLLDELFVALGPEYTMRQVRKLWRDDFLSKLELWFVAGSVLLELGAIQNEDKFGWYVMRVGGVDIKPFNGDAEYVFDTCVVCSARGSFKRCPCSKKMRYCGTTCRDLDWKRHKAEHKRKMAKKAARLSGRRANGGGPARCPTGSPSALMC